MAWSLDTSGNSRTLASGGATVQNGAVITSPRVQRVAILAPMRPELRPLLRARSLRRSHSGDFVFFSGAIGRVEIVATITGIGIRAAERTTERVLDFTAIDYLVVIGIAGGIGPSVAIGDLVVPELVIDRSTGTEHRPALLGDTAPRGTLVTSDGLIVDQNEVARYQRQGAIAIDMETSVIAAVCERRRCPWSVFRGISDRADDGSIDPAVFGLAGPDGGPNLPALARFLLTKPWRVPQLARLARGMKLAASVAAAAAIRAIERM
jgi:adenosylhomocysteine nucleosidase